MDILSANLKITNNLQLLIGTPALNKVWTSNDASGNGSWKALTEIDGASSGLDADLLDGQHGSYYQNASNINAGTLNSARLSGGYTGITAVGIATRSDGSAVPDYQGMETFWHSTGSVNYPTQFGVGLRVHRYDYNLAASSSYASFQLWSDNSSATNQIYLSRYTGSGWTSWARIWNESNDGASSGLDADLLDGQHGSYYENRDTTAVGFSAGTLTLTRSAGNLTVSLDGRYLPLTAGSSVSLTDKLRVHSTQPGIILTESDTTDKNKWIDVEGGTLRILKVNDALNSWVTQLTLDENGLLFITPQLSATTGTSNAGLKNDSYLYSTEAFHKIGTWNQTYVSGTGHTYQRTGVWNSVVASTAHTFTTLIGDVQYLNVASGATVSTYCAYYVTTPAMTGSCSVFQGLSLPNQASTNIATMYGIYSALNTVATTTRYFIYAAGTAPSYFAGDVSLSSGSTTVKANNGAITHFAGWGSIPNSGSGAVITFRTAAEARGDIGADNASNLTSGTVAAARMPAYTGDATSSAGTVSLTLANSGVTAGTYRSVTVDSKGRVTAGTNPTTIGGYGITDAIDTSSTDQVKVGGFRSNGLIQADLGINVIGGSSAISVVQPFYLWASSGKGSLNISPQSGTSNNVLVLAGRNAANDGWNTSAEFGWDGVNQRWFFDQAPYLGASPIISQSDGDARYLRLTGGTLSGGLTGTTASFSSTVTGALMVEKSVTFTPSTTGWYRIMTSSVSTTGRIILRANYDNKYGDLEFFYTTSGWSQIGSINLVSYNGYSSAIVSQIRVSGESASGACYIDLNISSATSPTAITVYAYGPRAADLVSSPVVGAVAGPVNVHTVTVARGFATSHQFRSEIATGTAPMVVASTTKVTNLNADLLDGYDSDYFLNTSASSQTKSGSLTVTGSITGGNLTINNGGITSVGSCTLTNGTNGVALNVGPQVTGQTGNAGTINIYTGLTTNPTYWHVVARGDAHAFQPSALFFFFYNGSSFIPTMLMTPSGYVMIGSSSTPTAKLQVETGGTNRRLQVGTGTSVADVVTIRGDDNTVGAALRLQNLDSTAAVNNGFRIRFELATTAAATVNAGAIDVVKDAEWTSTAATQDSSMLFSTTINGSLTERMRLTSEGVLQLTGTTSSSLIALAPSGRTSFGISAGSSSAVNLSFNTYYSASAWVHSAPAGVASSSVIQVCPGNGGVKWYASSNSSASWNISNGRTLWTDDGIWSQPVSTNGGAMTGGNRLLVGGSELVASSGAVAHFNGFVRMGYLIVHDAAGVAVHSHNTSDLGATGLRFKKGWLVDLEVTNTPTVNGGSVWHAGNDGINSGLDADLWWGLTPRSMLSNSGSAAFGGAYWSGTEWVHDSATADYAFTFRHDASAAGSNGAVQILLFPTVSTGAGSAAGSPLYFQFRRDGQYQCPDLRVTNLGTGIMRNVSGSSATSITGTSGYVTRWTAADNLGVGVIQDDGTNVGIGVAPSTYKFRVAGSAYVSSTLDVAGVLDISDGTATAPALAFISDPNTGVYRAAADILGFSAGGVSVMQLDTVTGYIKISNSQADVTTKTMRLMLDHYSTAQLPMIWMVGSSSSGGSSLQLGYGTSLGTGATSVAIGVAPNTTTSGTSGTILTWTFGNNGTISANTAWTLSTTTGSITLSPNSGTTVITGAAACSGASGGFVIRSRDTSTNAFQWYANSTAILRLFDHTGGVDRLIISSGGNVYPAASGTQSLGLTGSRWGDLFATNTTVGSLLTQTNTDHAPGVANPWRHFRFGGGVNATAMGVGWFRIASFQAATTRYSGLTFEGLVHSFRTNTYTAVPYKFDFTGGVKGYDNPTVTITGDGTGATAKAIVNNSGQVVGVIVTAAGSGYTTASVSFTAVTGSGATATANIISGGIDSITVTANGSGYEGRDYAELFIPARSQYGSMNVPPVRIVRTGERLWELQVCTGSIWQWGEISWRVTANYNNSVTVTYYDTSGSFATSSAGTGTISQSGTAVTGTGTNFQNETQLGDILTTTTGQIFVSGITNATSMTSSISQTISAGSSFNLDRKKITGTVSVTNGSGTITGSGTTFGTDVKPDDIIRIGGDTTEYTVTAIATPTSMTVTPVVARATASGLIVLSGHGNRPSVQVIRATNGLISQRLLVGGVGTSTLSSTSSNTYGVWDWTGRLQINTASSITSTNAAAVVACYNTVGANGTTDYCGYFQNTASAADANTRVGLCGVATTSHTSGTMGRTIGIYSYSTYTGSGGTLTDGYGMQVFQNIGAGVTVTNLIGLRLSNPTSSGTVTTSYSIYIENHSVGTTRWGIYSAFTGNSYLAGNLGLGATPSTFMLEVAGNIGPEADNTRNLGSASRRFNTIYGNTFDAATNMIFTIGATEEFRITASSLYTAANMNFGIGGNPTYTLDVIRSTITGAASLARFYNNATAATGNGVELLFEANRTTSGLTTIGSIRAILTDIGASTYKGALVFMTADANSPVERMRINNKGHMILTEISADPTTTDLTAAGSYNSNNVAIYTKSNKFVIAYYDGTANIRYITIPLDGATTTWTHSSVAP